MIGCFILYNKKIRGVYTKRLYLTMKQLFGKKVIVISKKGPETSFFNRFCCNTNNVILSPENTYETSIPIRSTTIFSWFEGSLKAPTESPKELALSNMLTKIKGKDIEQKTYSNSVYERFSNLEGDYTNVLVYSPNNTRGSLIFADRQNKLKYYLLEDSGFFVLLWTTFSDPRINSLLSNLDCKYYLLYKSNVDYSLTLRTMYLIKRWKHWVQKLLDSNESPHGNIHRILSNYIKGHICYESRWKETETSADKN